MATRTGNTQNRVEELGTEDEDVRTELSEKDERIAELEAESEALWDRLETFEARLDALESDATGQSAPADD